MKASSKGNTVMSNDTYQTNCCLDKLDTIFQMQKELGDIIIKRAGNRFPDDRVNQVNVLCDAMLQEVLELKNLTDWKYWKKFKGFDMSCAREELIDALHFLIHLAIIMDMNPQDFFNEYKRKWKINIKRQDSDY